MKNAELMSHTPKPIRHMLSVTYRPEAAPFFTCDATSPLPLHVGHKLFLGECYRQITEIRHTVTEREHEIELLSIIVVSKEPTRP
jgi:hypothetical protein